MSNTPRSLINIPEQPINATNEDAFIQSNPCLASDNEFIPVTCLKGADVFTKESTGDKNLFYNLTFPIPASLSNYTARFGAFCDFMVSERNWIKIRKADVTGQYLSRAGSLLHINSSLEATPLMLLCVKSKKLFTVNRAAPDKKDFCVVVDRKLIFGSEENNKIYRNVNKLYLSLAEAQGIDVLYTNNLIDVCFNAPYLKLPKFKTINEVIAYTKNISQLLLN